MSSAMSNNETPKLTDAEVIALVQAEATWNNIRAIGSTLTFEGYLKAAELSFPTPYVELVKSRDPYASPRP